MRSGVEFGLWRVSLSAWRLGSPRVGTRLPRAACRPGQSALPSARPMAAARAPPDRLAHARAAVAGGGSPAATPAVLTVRAAASASHQRVVTASGSVGAPEREGAAQVQACSSRPKRSGLRKASQRSSRRSSASGGNRGRVQRPLLAPERVGQLAAVGRHAQALGEGGQRRGGGAAARLLRARAAGGRSPSGAVAAGPPGRISAASSAAGAAGAPPSTAQVEQRVLHRQRRAASGAAVEALLQPLAGRRRRPRRPSRGRPPAAAAPARRSRAAPRTCARAAPPSGRAPAPARRARAPARRPRRPPPSRASAPGSRRRRVKSAKRAAKRATRRMRTGSSAKAGDTWRSTRASQVAPAAERVDERAVLGLRHRVDGQVAPRQVLLERDVGRRRGRRSRGSRARSCARCAPARTPRCVSRVQEDREVLADRQEAGVDHLLRRGADDHPVVVVDRQPEQRVAHRAADDVELHARSVRPAQRAVR